MESMSSNEEPYVSIDVEGGRPVGRLWSFRTHAARASQGDRDTHGVPCRSRTSRPAAETREPEDGCS